MSCPGRLGCQKVGRRSGMRRRDRAVPRPRWQKVRSKVAWRVFRGIDDAAATAATSATATAIANALHLDAGFAFPDGHASSLSAAHSPLQRWCQTPTSTTR